MVIFKMYLEEFCFYFRILHKQQKESSPNEALNFSYLMNLFLDLQQTYNSELLF